MILIQRFKILVIFLLSIPYTALSQIDNKEPIKVGWIGAITGPTAKWGAYQAALLGVEDVNAEGGINGRPLKVIFEDTTCNGKNAVTAFKKLTSIENVKFILGGHCSPDSMAFTSMAEHQKIISIAAMTSSPKLSDQGDYIFRLTPISTRLADLVAPYAYNKRGLKKIAIIHEQTDYVVPVAEKLADTFKHLGGTIVSVNAFNPGETDFRSIVLKSAQDSDGIYIGVQAPDSANLLIKQIRELNIKQIIFGNEQFPAAFLTASTNEDQIRLEGVIFAEPICDYISKESINFNEKYKQRYKVKALPFGCYTGEPYDTVQIISRVLRICGEDTSCAKAELYKIQNYSGASGNISFNSKGDVDKEYLLKQIVNSQIIEIK